MSEVNADTEATKVMIEKKFSMAGINKDIWSAIIAAIQALISAICPTPAKTLKDYPRMSHWKVATSLIQTMGFTEYQKHGGDSLATKVCTIGLEASAEEWAQITTFAG